MNSSVYIFGNLLSGYTQYPDEEFTKSLFQKLYTKVKATTQIAIRRDGNLMYYAYIRKLGQEKHIGFCVLLNNAALINFDSLFALYENVISNLVSKGSFIRFNERGDLIPNIQYLYLDKEGIEFTIESLKGAFNNLQSTAIKLPPINYSVNSESVKEYVVEDEAKEILKSSFTNGYTYIYKYKGYNTAFMSSYKGVLAKIGKERDELKAKCTSLSAQLSRAKAQQRNLIWVSVLGAVVLVLGVVVWNRVLFPSEVTHYETGEFVYYGPIKDGKPHGVGVAIYPSTDKDGRKYYIGSFNKGERQDSAAILFYQDGDYYYGAMMGDKWDCGMLYMNSADSHFRGKFIDNKPYDGVWYNHERLYRLKEGNKY